MGRRWGTQSRLEYIERLTNETVHFDYNDKTFENSCSIAHNLTETVSTRHSHPQPAVVVLLSVLMDCPG